MNNRLYPHWWLRRHRVPMGAPFSLFIALLSRRHHVLVVLLVAPAIFVLLNYHRLPDFAIANRAPP